MLESIISGAMILFLFLGAFKAFFFCVFSLIFVLYPFTTIGILLLIGVIYLIFEKGITNGLKQLNSSSRDDDQSA